jgi:uncharacterized protein YbaR (Trm112 family)
MERADTNGLACPVSNGPLAYIMRRESGVREASYVCGGGSMGRLARYSR